MARAARQSGSGLFRHTSLPEMAQAMVLPSTSGLSEMTKSRPVVIA